MPKFNMIFTQKIIFPDFFFFGGGHVPPPSLLSPSPKHMGTISEMHRDVHLPLPPVGVVFIQWGLNRLTPTV